MTLFVLNAYPLQFLQAEEIKTKFTLKDEECLLIVKEYVLENRKDKLLSLDEIAKYGNFKEKYFLKYKFTNSWQFLKCQLNYRNTIINIIEKNQAIDRIVFGHYGNHVMKDVASKYSGKLDILFIDEGISTLNYYSIREGIEKNKLTLKETCKRTITKFIYNFNYTEINNTTFFTAYDLESTPNTKIIKNNYTLVKNQTKLREKRKCVYVIGNPFIERELLSKEDYFCAIQSIIEYFPQYEILYLPHPYEKQENIKDIVKKFRIEIFLYEEPSLELHLINATKLPLILVTTVSTALLNSYYLFGEQMSYFAFKLPTEKWNYKSNMIASIYDFYEKLESESFEVIKL